MDTAPARTYTDLSGAPLAPDQAAACDALLATCTADGWVEYDWRGAAAVRPFRHAGDAADVWRLQWFAVFHGTAYALLDGAVGDDAWRAYYVPVLVDGQCVGQFPEEGRSGVLHVFEVTHRSGRRVHAPPWAACFAHRGWLTARELASETSAAVAERIAAGY